MNMALAEQKSFGLSVPFEKLTLDKLRVAVEKILETPR